MTPDEERTVVPAIPESQLPVEWQPTHRLIKQLVEIFPDSVIDILEVEPEDAHTPPSDRC